MTNYTAYPTSTDPTATLVWMSSNLNWLFPGILLLIFLSFSAGNFMYRERRNGKANLAESMAIGSTITTGASLVLFLIPGLISIETISICFSFMLIFVIWYMFSNKE